MAEDLIAKYAAMVATNPGNELARFSLAKALYDVGRYSKAAEEFRVCLQKKPDWMFPTILLGRCEIQLGNRVVAKEILERARELAIDQHHDGPLEEINGLLATL